VFDIHMSTRKHRLNPQRAEPKYLTTAEVAERRRMKESSLAQERYRNEGPPYVKDGARVLYPAELLEEYLAKRLRTPGVA
jgi:hypothetical protein